MAWRGNPTVRTSAFRSARKLSECSLRLFTGTNAPTFALP